MLWKLFLCFVFLFFFSASTNWWTWLHDIWKMNPLKTSQNHVVFFAWRGLDGAIGSLIVWAQSWGSKATGTIFSAKKSSVSGRTRNFSREEFKWQHAVVSLGVGFTCSLLWSLLLRVAKIQGFTLFLWVGKSMFSPQAQESFREISRIPFMKLEIHDIWWYYRESSPTCLSNSVFFSATHCGPKNG